MPTVPVMDMLCAPLGATGAPVYSEPWPEMAKPCTCPGISAQLEVGWGNAHHQGLCQAPGAEVPNGTKALFVQPFVLSLEMDFCELLLADSAPVSLTQYLLLLLFSPEKQSSSYEYYCAEYLAGINWSIMFDSEGQGPPGLVQE